MNNNNYAACIFICIYYLISLSILFVLSILFCICVYIHFLIIVIERMPAAIACMHNCNDCI